MTPATSATQHGHANLNAFLTKKTVTQGLLDVALLTANVAQLKYVMLLGPDVHCFYYPVTVLLYLSIILQVSTGLCLLLLGKTVVNEEKGTRGDTLNNLVTAQVFLITVLNVLISSFNINETNQVPLRIGDSLKSGSNHTWECGKVA